MMYLYKAGRPIKNKKVDADFYSTSLCTVQYLYIRTVNSTVDCTALLCRAPLLSVRVIKNATRFIFSKSQVLDIPSARAIVIDRST